MRKMSCGSLRGVALPLGRSWLDGRYLTKCLELALPKAVQGHEGDRERPKIRALQECWHKHKCRL